MTTNSAYWQGYQAFTEQDRASDNPYDPESLEFHDWNHGFNDAAWDGV